MAHHKVCLARHFGGDIADGTEHSTTYDRGAADVGSQPAGIIDAANDELSKDDYDFSRRKNTSDAYVDPRHSDRIHLTTYFLFDR
jgi:hypothetical protein